MSALPNVSKTPFLFNFQCLVVTGSQISLDSLSCVWNWSRAGEAMFLEERVRACPGLHCGHKSFHISKPPGIQISVVWNKELLVKSSGVSLLDPKELHYSGCSLAFLHVELNRSVPSSQPTESSGRLLLFLFSITDSGVYIKLYIMATLKHFCEQHKCYLPASPSGAVLVWALHYLCEYCQISAEILSLC